MDERISVFGASVTEQKEGYAVFLKKFLPNSIHLGYGGNHIDDAGIIAIDLVLDTNPSFCFIDFFSTTYSSTDTRTIECLDTIVYRFTNANCKLIFLFFLEKDYVTKLGFFKFVKEYLDTKKLFYIDLNDYLTYSPELLRDEIHTTPLGSQQYAEIIYNKFIENKHNITYPTNTVTTKYCNMKVLTLFQVFNKNLILEGNCEIVSFYLMIGPKSSKVEINGKVYPIWDTFCHYERPSFKIKNLMIADKIEIKISQEDPDYSTCRRVFTDRNIIKELKVVSIYYIGELKWISQ